MTDWMIFLLGSMGLITMGLLACEVLIRLKDRWRHYRTYR